MSQQQHTTASAAVVLGQDATAKAVVWESAHAPIFAPSARTGKAKLTN
ncbi:hypothetical protein [Paenarthrobacter sp. NPDC090522]